MEIQRNSMQNLKETFKNKGFIKAKVTLPIVMIVVAVGAYYLGTSHTAVAPTPTSAPAGVPVDVIQVHKQIHNLTQSVSGRVQAYKTAEIRPQVNGIITKRLFNEGSLVKKGDQLYQIDPAPYEANLLRAQAVVNQAKANAQTVKAKQERYKELIKINAISKQDFDDNAALLAQAEAEIKVAEAEAAIAQIDLDYTKVYAPISGIIGKSNVTEGALVTSNQTEALAKITQLDPIYVDMNQASKYLSEIRSQLQAGFETKVTLEPSDVYKGFDGVGKLNFTEVTIDETTGYSTLRATFANAEQILMPGMFVRAEIALAPKEGILVPHGATMRSADGSLIVWKITDGVAAPAPVVAERSVGTSYLITSGLKDGDIVVSKGAIKLKPNTPVAYQLSGK